MSSLRCFQNVASSLLSQGSFASRLSSSTRLGVHSSIFASASRLASTSSSSPIGRDLLVEKRSDGVAVITFDLQNSPVNVLRAEHTAGFRDLMRELSSDPAVKAVVMRSGKKGNFVAGADINMLAACQTANELESISEQAQQVFDEIAAMSKPVVAAIDGACMGGGFELALACKYRVASTSAKTVFSLPEVQIGLLPGAGGTMRVLDHTGVQKGLPLLLTGKQLKPDQARRLGLVDQVVDPAALEDAAIRAASDLASQKLSTKPRKAGLLDQVLEGPAKNLLLSKAREQVMKQTKGKYPAPLAILKVVEERLKNGPKAQLKAERQEFGKLGMTPESAALISIYKAHTALKTNRFGAPAKKVETMAVMGAGLMGAGIAQVSATKGIKVLLKDRDHKGVSRGEQQIYNNLTQRVQRRRMSAVERDGHMANIVPLTDQDPHWREHMAKADMVIEAVFEDLDLKKRLVQEIEQYIPEHCVVASNTSQLPISKIAEASKRPDKVVGMHYFSPVDKMPLLEVITTEQTSKDTAASAVQMGLRQGKTVIVVGDAPGFYTTRVLASLSAEGAGLLLEGVPAHDLDKHLRDFGYPVGLVSLLDEVGIDVASHIVKDLSVSLGDRVVGGADPGLINEMVQKGFCGRKSGKGFYLYNQKPSRTSFLDRLMGKKSTGKPVNPEALALVEKYRTSGVDSSKLPAEEIQHRMVARMTNEAVYCLQEGVLQSASDGDIGAVFGLGFPPFRGGPFRWIDSMGTSKFLDLVKGFQDKYGDRFEPAPLLVDYAKTNRKFHEK